jgi:hypothetical protein
MRLWVALAAAVALGTAAAWVDASCRPPRAGELDELLYYPSGAFVRQSTLGYETAAADVAWLRAVQYYGEHRLTDQKFDRIDHVMRIVGELDPRFEEPFVFGSFVLAQEMKQPDRGLALIRYGLDKNPGSWRLAFETGFLHYVCRHDYQAAARYFLLAARCPGHPEYADRFAAFASQKAGDTGMAILLWKRVMATGNKYMQDVARREIERLGGTL